MLLANLKLLHSEEPVDIAISKENITGIGNDLSGQVTGSLRLNFNNAVAFPGLINSHDHLDFNCFPVLSKGNYQNYTEWGKHIHEVHKEEIAAVLKIPVNLRAIWGMYKNLLAGVTTVVNHGSFLKIDDPLISILQDSQSLHSVGFQKKWKWKLNNPLVKNKVCVIHTGEGVDERSSKEIDELIEWNLLKRELVGIHGVAMNVEQAKKFKAIVWCPESNRILLNKDADVKNLKEHTSMVLGTDSTLTGNWNIWHHLRTARKTALASDAELFHMITKAPADLWNTGSGKIAVNKKADIVIVKKEHAGSSWDEFYAINPGDIQMIIQHGQIRSFDEEMFSQLEQMKFDVSRFHPITINGETKFVEGNIATLMDEIRSYCPTVSFPCNGYEKIKITADD